MTITPKQVATAERTVTDLYRFDVPLDEMDIADLITLLVVAGDQYTNDGNSLLTDEQYDSIYRYAELTDPTNKFFGTVGSDVRGEKVKLPFPMGGLTQAFEGDILKWKDKHNLHDQILGISSKMDGTSAQIHYRNGKLMQGFSRGDGFMGADITRHLRRIPSVPQEVAVRDHVVVRSEMIIKKSNFETLKRVAARKSGDAYKNPRNAVAGIMNASTNPQAAYDLIDSVAYTVVKPVGLDKRQQIQLLKEMGFLVVEYQEFHANDVTDELLTSLINKYREEYDYEVDGVVLEVVDGSERARINPTKDTLCPEYARKFKVASTDNVAITTVVDVELNVSKSGYLKPRVKFEPVELMGVTINYATGFNMQFINDNYVGPGAQLQVTRSGDVIPFIQEVVAGADPTTFASWFAAKVDSYGEWEWSEQGVDIVLKTDHPDIWIQRTLDFFVTIDAPHIREGSIKELFKFGYDNIIKIVSASRGDMMVVLGENGSKIYDGIHQKLTNIPRYVLAAASGEFGRGMGIRKMRKLYDHFRGEFSHMTSIAAITEVEGFEYKSARKITENCAKYLRFETELLQTGVVSIAEWSEAVAVEGALNGKVFVFTGFRNPTLKANLEAQGAEVVDTYTKRVTHVVALDPTSGSGKLQKAIKDGKVVIGVDEAETMVGD